MKRPLKKGKDPKEEPMKTLMLTILALIITATGALATPPTKISFQNMSAAGQTNYPVTCSIVGILDNKDQINDNNERLNTASLRTYALTKGGLANYSTSLTNRGSQFKIACVRSGDGTASTLKMYFNSLSSYWFPVSSGIYRFY
jgi:hypothetical protein